MKLIRLLRGLFENDYRVSLAWAVVNGVGAALLVMWLICVIQDHLRN